MRIQHVMPEAPFKAAAGTVPSVTDSMGKEREFSEMAKTERLKAVCVVRARQERTGFLYTDRRLMKSPEDVLSAFGRLFDRAGVEQLFAVALTRRGEPVAVQMIALGGVDSCMVSVAEIMKLALLCNCPAVLLLHNHPSGSLRPSKEDRAVTERVERAADIMGIELMDHLIVGDLKTGYSIKYEREVRLQETDQEKTEKAETVSGETAIHRKEHKHMILNRLTSQEHQEEWLRIRKSYLTGTDAGAVCGMNPYKSAMQVYLDKTGPEIEVTDNEAMRLGRDLEDYVAGRFAEATGKKVRKSNAMYVSDEHPFMMANVDRLVVGERAGLECKTASPYTADRWKDGNVPEWYYLQCQHYMKVLEMDRWYLAVLIFGKGFQYTCLERDEEMLNDLVSIEKDFWENHVQAKVLPPPDGSKNADELIQKYFHRKEGAVTRMTGMDEQITRRNELAALIKKMQAEQKTIEQELKIYLGNAEAQTGLSDRYRVTWTEYETRRIDTERLKKEQPEIYEDYSKVQKTSRLNIQAA